MPHFENKIKNTNECCHALYENVNKSCKNPILSKNCKLHLFHAKMQAKTDDNILKIVHHSKFNLICSQAHAEWQKQIQTLTHDDNGASLATANIKH